MKHVECLRNLIAIEVGVPQIGVIGSSVGPHLQGPLIFANRSLEVLQRKPDGSEIVKGVGKIVIYLGGAFKRAPSALQISELHMRDSRVVRIRGIARM